jgi:multidrug resistance efflux pump
VLLIVVSGGWGMVRIISGSGGARPDILTHPVRKERMQLTVVERGALESAVNRDVVCRVKNKSQQANSMATTIRSLIDDGTRVKQGQLLDELDSSSFQEQLKQQKITVDQAEAAKISAEENYNIVINQNESDIKTAEITLALAKIELQKYLEGDYEFKKKDYLGQLAIAQSDLEMWEERAAWSKRMAKRKVVTESQAQSDSARLQSARIALEKVQEQLRVLDDPKYGEKVKEVTTRKNAVEQAELALDRAKKQARAKEAQADADRKAKLSVYSQETSKYGEIEEEIRKCIVTAPQDGLVIYYIPEQARFGQGQQQSVVAQGEPVREGQKMMQIPDLSKMQVNTKVHEAMITRLKGERWKRTGFSDGVQAALLNTDPLSALLGHFAFNQSRQEFAEKYKEHEQEMLYSGQPALIRVDALNEVGVMKGHVRTVANTASQQDWLSSDVKVYQTMIAIGENNDGLKPGMSAEVTIFTDSRADAVLAVPTQAVIGTAASGKTRHCYVLGKDGVPAPREIEVGMSNEKFVEVVSGLDEGEEVILNPRAVMSEKDQAKLRASGGDQPAGPNIEMPKEKDGKGKGKGRGDGKGKGRQGGARGGRGGPPGGGNWQNMSEEERQKQRQAMIQRYRQAAPEQRKQMLQQVPEGFRDRLKDMLQQQGITVPN